MSYFRAMGLAEWDTIDAGEVLELEVEPGRVQEHRLQVFCNEGCDIWASDETGDGYLVASRSDGGLLRSRFTGVGTVSLRFEASGFVAIYRKYRRPQVLPASDKPSFATIQPGGQRTAPDLARMMMLVQLNARRREEALQAQIAELGDKVNEAYRVRTAAKSTQPASAVASPASDPAAAAGSGTGS